MKISKFLFHFLDGRARMEFDNVRIMQVASVTLGLCHLSLLYFFFQLHVISLIVFNIVSVFLYVWSFFIAHRNDPYLYFKIVYAEIFCCAVFSTIVVGMDAGFTSYLLACTTLAYLCYTLII